MTKVCVNGLNGSHTIPKRMPKEFCGYILKQLDPEHNMFWEIITCDKTGVFKYDPETKIISIH